MSSNKRLQPTLGNPRAAHSRRLAESMSTKPVIELPAFDTGKYDDCEFTMRDGDASLVVHVHSLPEFRIDFRKIRWHEFTAMYNCSAEQIDGSYFVLSEVTPSEKLESYIRNDKAGARAYRELHHYRIFLDETGCHEVFAESVSANNRLEGDG